MLRNIGSNWLLALVTIVATYAMTPFVIHALGQEGYGTWTLITSMTGYMSLLALGVPMTTVRYLAQHVAERDSRKINETIGSCAGLYLMIGLAALVIGAALSAVFAGAYDIPSGLRGEARLAFWVIVIQVAAGFIGFLPEGIMFAHHDFVLRNLVRITGVLLRLILTLGVMALHASLVSLALVQVVCLAFEFCASWIVVRRRYPGIRMSIADFDWKMVRQIFSFSRYVLLLHAGARLSFETDALVIGAFLDVASIPFYVVANSLIICLMDFTNAIAAVVMPMTARLSAEGQSGQLQEVFLKWSKVALSLNIMAGLFLIVLGPKVLGWWIGPSFERPSGTVLRILMVSSFLFLPVRGVALPVLMGLGKPKAPTFAFIGAGLLNLGLSILFVRPFGLPGVALGTAIPNALFAAVVLSLACHELGIALTRYMRYVVPRAALGALVPAALLLWFKLGIRVQTVGGFLAAGSAMVLVFGVIWVMFVYRDDPYVDLKPHLVRLFAWSRA